MEQIGAGTLAEIRKEAATWLIEMDSRPADWDRKSFVGWLKTSPQHIDEFLAQAALFEAFQDVECGQLDLQQLMKDSGNVVHWTGPAAAAPPAGKRRGWLMRLVAGFLFIVCMVGLWSVLDDRTRVLATAVGEQRAVRLKDGSVLHLNTDSRVEIRFNDATREVRLTQGEAMFTVERDVHRPFRVITNAITVEALGTQFNVRRRASDTVVTVVEGRVAVVGPAGHAPAVAREAPKKGGDVLHPGSPRSVASRAYEAGRPPPAGSLAVVGAGEQVRVSTDGSVQEEALQNVTAWRQRQLVFNDTPLADVIDEVSRYNAKPRLHIEGNALGARQLNGVFAADDPESLVQFLQREGFAVRREGDDIFIGP